MITVFAVVFLVAVIGIAVGWGARGLATYDAGPNVPLPYVPPPPSVPSPRPLDPVAAAPVSFTVDLTTHAGRYLRSVEITKRKHRLFLEDGAYDHVANKTDGRWVYRAVSPVRLVK